MIPRPRATLLVTALLAMLVALPVRADFAETSAGTVEVLPVVTDLDTPWSVAFLPDGGFLITQRSGQLLRIGADGQRSMVAGVPEVRASGQGGLFDVVLDPDFAANNRLYLSYAEPVGVFSARTALVSATLGATGLENLKVLFRQIPDSDGGRHFGGRIVPDGQGNLFLTLGDRGDRQEAQNLNHHIGKIVRIRTDGTIPEDNPYIGGPAPEIWSLGHRNAQGAALDETGQLWTASHGARGGDEVNRPAPGNNYGWPVISYGRHYSGGKIGVGTANEGMEQPVWYWDPSIAPSGMAIYSGKLWPEWKGDIFVGSLKFDMISRLDRDGDTIASEERLLGERYSRIRDVREGPDGALWFLSVGDGTLYRMRPGD